MSVVTASTSKGEKSKKFQSLDINNIYQGSATKPTQKSLPQKHGLQSLGKVPTARRAPANLPSLKAENGGNDPAVNLVPSGSAGWGKDDPTGGSGANTNAAPTTNKQLVPTPSGGGQNSQSNGPKHDQQQPPNHPGAGQAPNHPPSDLTTSQPQQHQQQQPHPSFPPPHSHQQQPSWKHVATSSAPNSSQPAFLGQRSNPLFVQEFPSLTPNGTTDGQQAIQPALQGSASSGSIAQKLKGETPDALKYGPGPNLRPQSYGNWALGTAGGTPKQQSDTDGGVHPSQQPQQPHPQQAASARPSQQPLQHGGQQQPGVPQNPVTSSFKFDVSTKPGAASITGIRKSASASNAANSTDFKPSGGRPELVKKPHQPQARGPPPTSYQAPGFIQQQIIDVEKLKRLDELDHAESDWTKSDDTFDYNKKIASDDEDEFQSNWTDQIKPIKSTAAPPSGDHYGDHSQLNSSQPQQQQPRRIVLPSSANSDFVHDEEKERQAKNEEVLKTIERAKRRREEEEQKFGKTTQQYGGGSQHYGGGGNSSSSSRDGYEGYGRGHFDPPRRQHSGGDRNNRRSPAASAYRPMERSSGGGGGGGTFGKFDVGGKDDEGYGFSGKKQQQQTPPPLQQQPQQQQSSVPPRFKRNGMELHPVKRVSPPKEPSPDNDGGGSGGGDPPSCGSNSRASSIRGSPGCWDRHSTGSSSEPSAALATTTAAAGPAAEKEPGSESEPTASVVDPDRHFSGSTTSNNEKKDFGDLKFEGDHYDNWSGGGGQDQQHSLEQFDSRPKPQQQPRSQGRDFTRNRKPRTEGGAVAAAPAAPARLEEPRRNNRGEPTRGKSDNQQQTQPKKIILPNKNKGGGSKKVDEPSPAAVVEAVDQEKTEVVVDPPTDLMKSLALSADIGGVPTLDQLQPKEAEAPEVKKDPEAAQPQQKMHQPQTEPLPPPQAVSQVEAASGWFAPRGQPSRRGRGGVTGSTAGQQRQTVSAAAPSDSVTEQGKDVEWDASSDRSFEDKKMTDGSYFGGNRGGNRGSGRYNGGSGMPGGANRQPNTKDGKRGVSDRVGSGRDKLGGGGVGNNAAYGGSGARDDTRRQNKLPPRLAKQKEQNRLASSGGGGGGGSGWGDITEPTSAGGGFSTWDQSTTVMRQQQAYIGQQNDFGNFRSEEASKEGSATTTPTAGGVESQNAPMQTIIFENTNFKGRQQQQQQPGPPMAGHNDRGFKSDFPIGFADAAAAAAAAAQSNEKDLRLDFGTFGGSGGGAGDSEATQNGSQKLPSRSPMHHVQHPTTDDLNMKIASAKKIWEMSPAAPGDQATATAFGQGFQNATSSQDPKAFVPPPAISSAADDSSFSTDKAVTEAVAGAASNVAKVRPQQMPPHQQQQPQVSLPQGYPGNTASAAAAAAAGTPFQLDVDRAASLRAAMMGQSNSSNSYNRSGLPAQLQSPQSLLNQSVPPNLYQAFQLDHGRGVPPAPTSQLYPAYAPGLSGAAAAAQSVLLSSSGLSSGAAGSGSDMFGSQSQFRLQNQSGAFGPGPSAATTTLSNPVLLSQSMKTSQIGPIGTKANSYQTGSLGMSAGGPPPPPHPPAGTSPLHLIPYDNTQANHYAMASTRLAAAANQTGQTAFYAALAASQQQSNRAAAAQSAAAASAAGFSAAQGFQQAGAGAFGPNAALNAQMRSAVAAAAHAASQSSGPHGPPPPHLANYMAKANADAAAVQAAAAQIQAKRNQEIGFGGLSQHQFGGGGQQGKGGYGGGASAGVNVSIAASVAAAAAAAAASSNGHSGSQAANVSSAVPSSTVTAAAAAAAAVANNVGGRNYSPTPIQRPAHQGKPIVGTDDDSGVDLKDKKKKAEEN